MAPHSLRGAAGGKSVRKASHIPQSTAYFSKNSHADGADHLDNLSITINCHASVVATFESTTKTSFHAPRRH